MKPLSLFLLTLSFSFVIDIMIAKYLLVDVGPGSAVDRRRGKNSSTIFTFYKTVKNTDVHLKTLLCRI